MTCKAACVILIAWELSTRTNAALKGIPTVQHLFVAKQYSLTF
jgi:hypothetical protein